LWGGNVLRFAAGNFYINDKPTGAVVGQQPFGGHLDVPVAAAEPAGPLVDSTTSTLQTQTTFPGRLSGSSSSSRSAP
jgi:1-pyrroline-5-carboxylate dehydrogenase